MTPLGFSVAELAPWRGGRGGLRMGLVPLGEEAWRQPWFDVAARREALAQPGAVIVLPDGEAAGREVAALFGVEGGLREAAATGHEDLCMLVERDGRHVVVGGAVGWPTDWQLADKIGLPLLEVHAPIHGYADRLASGVEHFLHQLSGQVFGRANWFVVASDDLAYLPADDPAGRFGHVTAANAGETLFVRCERQTFRRLPETGAILFAIGIHVAPLGSLPTALVPDLVRAVEALAAGEDERRAAPFYLPALRGYAAMLRERVAA